MGIVPTVEQSQEMGCFYHFCPCQEKKRLPIETIEEGLKRRDVDAYRKSFLESLGLKIVEVWECEWWSAFRNNVNGERDFLKIRSS